jgi:uncharacterized membrane protein
MNKNEFVNTIKTRLSSYPENEIDRAMSFYVESIDDRIEDGMTEEEAVASLGDINDIVNNIKGELPLNTIVKNKIENQKKKSNSNVWLIVVLLVTSPLWVPMVLAIGGAIIGLIAGIFATGVALVVMFGISAICGIIAAIFCMINSIAMPAGAIVLILGSMLLSIGLIIPVTKGVIWVFKKLIQGIKWCYRKIKIAMC